jgi:hypothetical protein
MTKPPNHQRKSVSQEELNREFNENGWEERLKTCQDREFYNRPTPPQVGQTWGTNTVGIKYYKDGILVAMIFHYETPDGKIGASGQRSPKILLIDEVYHYV